MKLLIYSIMVDGYVKICVIDLVELILKEERQKIKKFYLESSGKSAADLMDSYVAEDSEIIKILKKIRILKIKEGLCPSFLIIINNGRSKRNRFRC